MKRRGYDIPSSTSPSLKVQHPHPSKMSSGGTNRRLLGEARDIAPTSENPS